MKSSVQSTAELARVLGLSRWTVSRALNGHPGISPETVRRIREEARRHGFAPSLLGRGLRAGKTNLIGICLPDLVDYFLTSKITQLHEAIERLGFHPVMQMTNGTDESESIALERFAAMRCAAVVNIASSLKSGSPGVRGLVSSNTPVLRIDPLFPSTSGSVQTDRAFAMKEALSHFYSLGHRRFAVMGISPAFGYGPQRVEGLRAACKELRLNFHKDLFFLNTPEQEFDFEAGAVMAREYMSQAGRRATAILALNDRIAAGAMRVLQSQGVSIPKDVSMIGYDNADFSAYSTPALTTLDPQVSELIERAVELLLAGLNKGTLPPSQVIVVKPKLVIRESTGPAPF